MSNKKDIVANIATKLGVNKNDAADIVTAVLDSIEEGLIADQIVQFAGFGTFIAKKREAHTGRNPKTGQPIDIAAYYTVRLRNGKNLKEAMNASLAPKKKIVAKKKIVTKKK